MSRAPIRIAVLALVLALAGGVVALPASPAGAAGFTDVPNGFWAKTAIDHVAGTYDWMRDFGDTTFKPEMNVTKRRFAMTLVKAFDPDAEIDPSITFTDLPETNAFFRYANVAVSRGWIAPRADGKFKPFNGVTTAMAHRGLVLALGLQPEVDGLLAIHTADGAPFSVNAARFPYMVLGMQLGFRYNHANETEDVMPGTILHRDELAWSLWKASTVGWWQLLNLVPYRDIEVPVMPANVRAAVEFGFKYVGYPYLWAGEWHKKTASGYCCGTQPKGGFDCSGLMWWVLKKPSGGYDNVSVRGYTGWSLPERSSSVMANAAPQKLTYAQTLPGDLMFHDSASNPGVIGHVNVYLGNGWALDSSGGRGGASVIKVDSGWYYDHFMWSRRLTP